MAAERLGWKVMLGISNTTITNGLWSDDKTCRPDIEVFVPELTPNAIGKPVDSPVSEQVSLTNPLTGEAEKSSIPKMDTIRCQYMGGSNFIVPCVHKGEQVWVLQYEGGEISYFWLPVGRDEGLRLREHGRWFFMDVPKSVEGNNKWAVVDDKNTYFIDINTNPGAKIIHIHTSMSDSEPHGYDVRIMPEKSRLEVIDNLGNELSLDSKNTVWFIRNIDDSIIRLRKKIIDITCHDTINMHADNVINIDSGKEINVDTATYTNTSRTQNQHGKIYDINFGNISTHASAEIKFTGPMFNNLCSHGHDGDIICCGSNTW